MRQKFSSTTCTIDVIIILHYYFQEPDDLFEKISQALVNAFDRDAISGWGAEVIIM